MALISTLFILLFRVVFKFVVISRSEKRRKGKEEDYRYLSLIRSDKTKWHKSATKGMSGFGWLEKHGKA